MKEPWGVSYHIDCRSCDSEIINSKEKLLLWVKTLIDEIGMELYREPECIYFGTEPSKTGLSIIALITTSNVIAHCNEKDNSTYIDLFTCRLTENLDEKIEKNILKWFNPVQISIEKLYRQA